MPRGVWVVNRLGFTLRGADRRHAMRLVLRYRRRMGECYRYSVRNDIYGQELADEVIAQDRRVERDEATPSDPDGRGVVWVTRLVLARNESGWWVMPLMVQRIAQNAAERVDR